MTKRTKRTKRMPKQSRTKKMRKTTPQPEKIVKNVHWCDGEVEGKMSIGCIIPVLFLSRFECEPASTNPEIDVWTPGDEDPLVVTMKNEGLRETTILAVRKFLRARTNLSCIFFYKADEYEKKGHRVSMRLIDDNFNTYQEEKSYDDPSYYPPVHPDTQKLHLDMFIERLRSGVFCKYSGNRLCCDAKIVVGNKPWKRTMAGKEWRPTLISRGDRFSSGDMTRFSMWDLANQHYHIKNTISRHGNYNWVNDHEFTVTPRETIAAWS